MMSPQITEKHVCKGSSCTAFLSVQICHAVWRRKGAPKCCHVKGPLQIEGESICNGPDFFAYANLLGSGVS